MSRRAAAAVELSPALALAGCRLVVDDGQFVVLDGDAQELERGGRSSRGWLLAVCEQLMIERWAAALGFRWKLHSQKLWMVLWSPGIDPEPGDEPKTSRAAKKAFWRPFGAALCWLIDEARRVEEARELQQAQEARELQQAQEARQAQEAQEAQEVQTSTTTAARVMVRLRSGWCRRRRVRRWEALWPWFVAQARSEVSWGNSGPARGPPERRGRAP